MVRHFRGLYINPMQLLKASLNYYPQKWCKEKFRKPYPPISVVTSSKSRSRALEHFPFILNPENNGYVDFYTGQLLGLSSEAIKLLVEHGFLDGLSEVNKKDILDFIGNHGNKK